MSEGVLFLYVDAKSVERTLRHAQGNRLIGEAYEAS
jgi:hypothetical protein